MLMAAAMIPLAFVLHLLMSTLSDKFLKEWLGRDVVDYLKLCVVSSYIELFSFLLQSPMVDKLISKDKKRALF